jgi:hypothetical protein
MDENKYRYYASKFKVVLEVTAVTVTLTVPPAPIVAVPDAAPVIYSISCRSSYSKMASAPEQIDYSKCCCHW